MTRIITVALALLGLTLVGCPGQDQAPGHTIQEWYGTWEGTDENIVDESVTDDVISRTLKMVRLRINPDGTFSLMRGGVTASGDHLLTDDKVTLRIKEWLDRPIEDRGEGAEKMNKDILVWIQEDGSAELVDQFYTEAIVLTKRSQP